MFVADAKIMLRAVCVCSYRGIRLERGGACLAVGRLWPGGELEGHYSDHAGCACHLVPKLRHNLNTKAQLQLLTNLQYVYVQSRRKNFWSSCPLPDLSFSALSWSLRVHCASGRDHCSLYAEAGMSDSSHRLQVR